AIISYRSKQDSYFIDSKIAGTAAVVSKIYEDRVILDVDGVLQTLMLDGLDRLKQQESNQAKAVERLSSEVVDIDIDRAAILKDPSKLTDYIRISPYREGDKVLGYRLQPGKDRTLFDQAGLQDGDLAIELNGVDLTDSKQAFSLMRELPTMTEVSITVERNGQLHELYLTTP
ncbi:MAG: type II secretion system protein GspC, partial [Psychromonas sp.]|nr:type II secretion system protein GspC [Psychromonas sp.]